VAEIHNPAAVGFDLHFRASLVAETDILRHPEYPTFCNLLVVLALQPIFRRWVRFAFSVYADAKADRTGQKRTSRASPVRRSRRNRKREM